MSNNSRCTQMTPWEAFKKEFMFSLDIRITEKKIINPNDSESVSQNSSRSNSKSMASSSRHNRDNLVGNGNESVRQIY